MYKLLIKTEDLKACVACGKDARAALVGLHITPEYIESTNGSQILRIGRENSSTDAPAGVYVIISSGKAGVKNFSEAILDKIDLEYLKTDSVIPATAGVASINIQLLNNALSLTQAIINLHTYTGAAYSLALLECIAPLCGTWRAYKPAEGSKPLRMDYTAPDNTTYCAVLMPFELKD